MIQKQVTLASGVVADTWAPITSTFDHRSGQVRTLVGLWLNADAYAQGLAPVEPPRERMFRAPEIAAALNGTEINFTGLVVALPQASPEFAPPEPAP